MKLVRYLANLGYGSRREVDVLMRMGRLITADGTWLIDNSDVAHEDIRFDGNVLDPAPGALLMLHKPLGYVCSTRDAGRLVYDLLPPRFLARKPIMACVGRLDRDTSGLLLLTDDGSLLHRLTRPKSHVRKRYEVELARPLRGDEATLFGSGALMLNSEETPLAPAQIEVFDETHASLTITEGRYHQVRRMFAAAGNHVLQLHRSRIGALELGALPVGEWCVLDEAQRALLFG